MTHRARVRQIDIERAIRAARKTGAVRVIQRPDGSLSIEINSAPEPSPQSTPPQPAPAKDFVL